MKRLIKSSGECVLNQVKAAESFASRFKGLMFSDPLPDGEGLLFRNCRKIHTHFMKYDLEIIYMNKEYVVVDTELIQPGKNGKNVPDASHLVEARAGGLLCSVGIGDKLKITEEE